MASDLVSIWPVVYMGGACGDLITTMIDPTGAEFDSQDRRMLLPDNRMRLKRPHDFVTDEQKDQYLDSVRGVYTSVPSHDVDYHVKRGHRFIAITVTDQSDALWAAVRFKNVHRPQVWQTVCEGWRIRTVEEYAQLMMDNSRWLAEKTRSTIDLGSIRSGQAVPKLEHLIGRKITENAVHCYTKWQLIQNATS
jgi:hypothetical protein